MTHLHLARRPRRTFRFRAVLSGSATLCFLSFSNLSQAQPLPPPPPAPPAASALPQPNPSVTSATAQTLTIGVRGGPASIDPHFTAPGTHAEALKHVFDTLVWSGRGLELEPRLAESWRAIDATTWEFKPGSVTRVV